MDTVGFWVTQASTALLVLLGAFAIWVRPRTRTHRAFGLAAAGLGAGVFFGNFIRQTDAGSSHLALLAWSLGSLAAFTTMLAGLFAVLRRFPRPMAGAETMYLALPAALTLGGLGFGVATGIRLAQFLNADWVSLAALSVVSAVALQVTALGALLGAAGFFALRFRSTPAKDADDRIQYAMMAAGLGAWPAAVGGGFVLGARAEDRLVGSFGTLGTLLVIAVWLLATRGAGSALARNIVLLLSGCAIAALAVGFAVGSGDIDDTGFYGAVRLLSFVIFAYAILRHQLMGLDVKVRWTVSRGAVAAVFVALVIIGSQIVQNVTQDEFGVWGGAVLGGMALFILAPLQRAADAFAQRVVPPASAAAGQAAREATLTDAIRMAVRGGITRREELTLAALARDLGVDARRALELRGLVEDEPRTQ